MLDLTIGRWVTDVATKQWAREDAALAAISDALPVSVLESRPLAEVHRLDRWCRRPIWKRVVNHIWGFNRTAIQAQIPVHTTTIGSSPGKARISFSMSPCLMAAKAALSPMPRFLCWATLRFTPWSVSITASCTGVS